MIKKLIFGFILSLLLFSKAFCADYFTLNYNLCVPEEGSRNWTTKISADMISIDTILNKVSGDGVVLRSGTNAYLNPSLTRLGIGTTSPLLALETIGQISGDAYRFDIQTASPDTTTLLGPCLVASMDIAGVVRLNFYDGSQWHRVTLE